MGGNYSTIGTVFGQMLQSSNYGQHGFDKHSKDFDPKDLEVDLSTTGAYFITGANSGIGKAAAIELAKKNANIHLICRNQQRGEEARQEIITKSGNQNIRLRVVDISLLSDVQRFANEILTEDDAVVIKALVHNAGALSTKREETKEGNEVTFATHVLGPFLPTSLLEERLRWDKTRVLWTTSAGMYTQKLDPSNLQSEHGSFDGTNTYAQMKRAQVILTEMWAEKFAGSGAVVNSWHPGWTKTPGLDNLFADKPIYKHFESGFRETEAGADTLVWLCAKNELHETGKLWFDRQEQSTTVRLSNTDSSPEERKLLWDTLTDLANKAKK